MRDGAESAGDDGGLPLAGSIGNGGELDVDAEEAAFLSVDAEDAGVGLDGAADAAEGERVVLGVGAAEGIEEAAQRTGIALRVGGFESEGEEAAVLGACAG